MEKEKIAMKKIAASLALSGLFVGALALAAVVWTPERAEAQLCVPQTQFRERKTSEGGCCSTEPPKRTWYYVLEKREQVPNCTWTDWSFVKSFTKCKLDATCGPRA
jgi:hypothetical protein